MADLLPCPNPKCDSYRGARVGGAIGVYNVTCGCGVASPFASDRDKAIAAWNELPRQPQWTEYDGSEKTLPPKGDLVLIWSKEWGRVAGKCFGGNWRNSSIYHPAQAGDRWTPWPLSGGGE